ncbi:hypothetical protein R3P38DRAFT_2802013 [Favolaschia claudopus]|uniref:Uncharacterized protein n=1 Tax=Favolaschia claudopus TaxID=2862362 RepID=A0AAV9ZVL0_9AGAR
MIQGGMLLDASRLQNFAAVRMKGIPAQLSTIAIEVPARIISWTSINLRLLDVRTKADDTMWCHFFDSCTSLEELVWQRDGPVRATRTVSVPSLRVFRTQSVNFPPPILALHLITLNVTDEENPFTAYQFKCLVGTNPAHLEHLDMLSNPTRKMDIDEIFRTCANLNQYLKYDRRKFESVQFAHGPPLNSWAVTARKRYEALCRVAFKVELNTVKFEPRAERLRVRKFSWGRQVWGRCTSGADLGEWDGPPR